MSYVIVSGLLQTVESKVNNLLSIGFNLHGSMSCVINQSNSIIYTQPMSHLQFNMVKSLTLKFNSTGSVSTVDVVVVHNSQKLRDLLQNFKGDHSRWIHCKHLNDMSVDMFVLDEQEAFNDRNIEQGFNYAYRTKFDGGRRSKTSRRRL
jgi:hypothetical protein